MAKAICEAEPPPDCLEVMVEHFMPLSNTRRSELENLCQQFSLIPHGVSLSIGSASLPEDAGYWSDLRSILDILDAPFFGEHLSFSRANGFDIWHLSPVLRTVDSLTRVCDNVERVQERVGRRLALETITEAFVMPGAELSSCDFYVEVCSRTGCGLILDLENLEVNQTNQTGPTVHDLAALDACDWVQFHLAGSSTDGDGYLIDSHDAPLGQPTLDAFVAALAYQIPSVVIIERDGRLEAFSEVFDDMARVRRAMASRGTASP